MKDLLKWFLLFLLGMVFGIFTGHSKMSFIPKTVVVEEIHSKYIMLECEHWIQYDKKYSIGDTIKLY